MSAYAHYTRRPLDLVRYNYICQVLPLISTLNDRKVCGHSFSAKAIREYLGGSRTARKVCPTAGCNKVISMGDLEENRDLKRKAENAARRERMRAEEEDEDADVVE